MHRIPSLACLEPGCAGKHCYL